LGFGTPNKIKYNGYEANDFLNLNIFESFFRIHDPQLGRFWQIDPKPSDWESPFAAMGNNPVLRFDVLGDTIGLGNLYEKDKNGTYKNSNEILAFELYASTGAGKKYLLDHAEKGFNLKGALVKDLNINAKSEGKSSANGVDIGLAVVPHISGGDAKTDDKIEGGRLKISFQIEKSSIGESLENKQIYRDNMLKKVDSWTHEFLLHGDLLEKRFLNGSSIKPYSHSNESLLASKYYSFGIQVLQDVQNLPVGMNKGLTPHSANYLYNSIMMPGLGHLVPPLGSSKY